MRNRNDRYSIKDYFTFTRSERYGVIALIVCIGFILAAIGLLPYLLPAKPPIDVRKFEKEIAAFEKACDTAGRQRKMLVDTKDSTSHSGVYYRTKKDGSLVIELNSADSVLLCNNLPGIGPVFAARIVKYRGKLGGFYALDQLYEVRGLPSETIEKISRMLIVDTTKIERLNINTASFGEINAHPYISFDQTKSIMRLRAKGRILGLQPLIGMDIFTPGEIKKVRPYLRFE